MNLKLQVLLIHVVIISQWTFVQNASTKEASRNNSPTTERNELNTASQDIEASNTGEKPKESEFIDLKFPEEWEGRCNGSFQTVTRTNVTSQFALLLKCTMDNSSRWSLGTYRRWIAGISETLKRSFPAGKELRVALDVKCTEGSLSLPWPYRAQYLWYLKVRNCNIYNHLDEYHIQSYEEPDIIKGIDIADSVHIVNAKEFLDTMDMAKFWPKSAICHPENIEAFTKRNVSMDFTNIDYAEEPGNNTLSPSDRFAKFNQDNTMNGHRCNYQFWRYIDESQSSNIQKLHLHYLTRNARFPALEYFNLSNSLITDVFVQILGWRTYFPKIKYFDLSHNRISTFAGFTDSGLPDSTIGTLDLSYNNFTSLNHVELDVLRLHTRTASINLFNNPWVCDCNMKDFVNFLHDEKAANSTRQVLFNDLMALTCNNPNHLRGNRISELSIAELSCTTEKTSFLVAPFVAIGVVVVFLIIFILLLYRYRKHITILVYTRLYIVLPCQHLEKHLEKTYDAFVAYSSADFDTNWVTGTLAPRLERPEYGICFKLCLHHRDFAVGAAIAENISRSVEESRRTLIVLTRSFIESEWCVMEFRMAFHQSLMEKKKHMIFIILEDIPLDELDPDMRRCLQTLTFVRADDKYFWDKLIYALSEKTSRMLSRRKQQENGRRRNSNTHNENIAANNPGFAPGIFV